MHDFFSLEESEHGKPYYNNKDDSMVDMKLKFGWEFLNNCNTEL